MFKGGDGVIRELEFTRPLVVSILSERRSFQPYGLEGGEAGARGLNLLHKLDGRVINLGGKNTVDVRSGDRLVIHSPGGGGFGSPTGTGTGTGTNTLLDTQNSIAWSKGKKYLTSGSLHQYTLNQESV